MTIGKYRVQSLYINGKSKAAASCEDSVLTVVYFDRGNDIVWELNSQQRRLLGSYAFNQRDGAIKTIWRYPASQTTPFIGRLSAETHDQITLSGAMGSDSIRALLVKAR